MSWIFLRSVLVSPWCGRLMFGAYVCPQGSFNQGSLENVKCLHHGDAEAELATRCQCQGLQDGRPGLLRAKHCTTRRHGSSTWMQHHTVFSQTLCLSIKLSMMLGGPPLTLESSIEYDEIR